VTTAFLAAYRLATSFWWRAGRKMHEEIALVGSGFPNLSSNSERPRLPRTSCSLRLAADGFITTNVRQKTLRIA
jgi:hypothetical protein